jgi:hypothetical protein
MSKTNSTNLSERQLINLYLKRKLSTSQIARKLGFSENKINYWISKYGIEKRQIGEALYIRNNPGGDPFTFQKPDSSQKWFLFGLGLGLYWGEGTKRNKTSVRLGNTDPRLIRVFLEFLYTIYGAERQKFRFGLQIFGDMSKKTALSFWRSQLNVSREQFGKVIVTPHRGIGTYREKTKHGVLTVYFSNKKLRNILCHEIDMLM